MKKTILFLVLIIAVGCMRIHAQQDSASITLQSIKVEFKSIDSLDQVLSSLRTTNDTLPLWKNHYNWISYQMKLAVNAEGQDMSLQCFFVNRTDSLLYFNLHKSGIELARIVLTPDTVTIVNKLQKQYYKGDYSVFVYMLGFPLTFDMVQSLMNGRDFMDCDGHFSAVTEAGKTRYIWAQRQCGATALMQEITIGDNGVMIQNDITELQTGRDAVITYNNPHLEEVNLTPDKEEAHTGHVALFDGFTVRSDSQGLQFKAEISKLRINVPGPTSVKIPDSFSPIIIKQ